jgi:ATP-dependent DNA helicase RecQ
MMVQEENVAIYMVANQATLKEIATYLPLTKKDLLQISGFGKAKVDKYGDDVIEAVEEFCTRNDIKSNMVALPSKASKEKTLREKNAVTKTDTKTISFNLYKEGKSIAEIAVERKLTVGSIESHMIPFIGDGEIEIDNLISAKKQQLIIDAVAVHGALSHTTLIKNLPPDVTYGEIKMMLASGKIKAE